MTGIVVGLDGSPHSQDALNWAIAESSLRNAPVTVLAVAPAPGSIWGITGAIPASEETTDKVRQAAQKMVDDTASSAGQAITLSVVSGVPADELIKASEGADLLVVAARGSGGFARLVIGSVSSQVVQHARCPVVVVPGRAH
ncbi:MAG TPA: universal stress protein [Streptosporangiaceae bacterium]|jgi:nucleotide-binding universal stress UspA family protein